jgi:hypothetical protein
MPSLFRFVPTHAPTADAERETPSLSSALSVTGSVASEEFQPNATIIGSRAADQKRTSDMRAHSTSHA